MSSFNWFVVGMCDSSIPESIPFWPQNIIRNNFQNKILDFNRFVSWNKEQLNSFFFGREEGSGTTDNQWPQASPNWDPSLKAQSGEQHPTKMELQDGRLDKVFRPHKPVHRRHKLQNDQDRQKCQGTHNNYTTSFQTIHSTGSQAIPLTGQRNYKTWMMRCQKPDQKWRKIPQMTTI